MLGKQAGRQIGGEEDGGRGMGKGERNGERGRGGREGQEAEIPLTEGESSRQREREVNGGGGGRRRECLCGSVCVLGCLRASLSLARECLGSLCIDR